MSAKIIILVRISTTKQEILTQKKELIELATSDGWEKEDLIVIEGVGASAIKLNDIYLEEMQQLYKTIEENDIAAVYAWEISRIGRNEEILMKFKNFLIERKIQLVIKNPSLRLLNNDGSVNNGIELAFSLFATMSKQEMEIKQERFKRAKQRNKAEGKYNGGRIKIGYRLDEHKHFIEDTEKAQLVRDIFDWYINGMSLKKIYDRLVDMGIYSSLKNFKTGGKRVGYILRDSSYLGNKTYPQIVNKDIFDKAQDILSNRRKWHNSDNIYFCKGLIKDTTTGATLVARLGTLVYYLRHRTHSIALNLNVMDYIALNAANVLIAHMNARDAQTNKNEYRLKIEENNKIINSKRKQIEEYEKANQRAIEMNIMRPEHFPEERLNILLKQNDNAIQSLRTALNDLQTENTRMQNWLDGTQQFINTIFNVSDVKKKEMIDAVIDSIEITKIEQHHFHIVVKNKIGFIDSTYWDYSSKGHRLHIEQVFSEDRRLDITDTIMKHKRFERKRYDI